MWLGSRGWDVGSGSAIWLEVAAVFTVRMLTSKKLLLSYQLYSPGLNIFFCRAPLLLQAVVYSILPSASLYQIPPQYGDHSAAVCSTQSPHYNLLSSTDLSIHSPARSVNTLMLLHRIPSPVRRPLRRRLQHCVLTSLE